MGLFRPPANDGTPNEKPYMLQYEDGDLYADRSQREPQRYFTLLHAITVANAEAASGNLLLVVDPNTDIVLWTGQAVTRSALRP